MLGRFFGDFLILHYLHLIFQAEVKEQEREKEELKRKKKLELSLKNLLKELNIDYELSWEEAKTKIENEEEYLAFDSDSERIRVYKVSEIKYGYSSITFFGCGPCHNAKIKI